MIGGSETARDTRSQHRFVGQARVRAPPWLRLPLLSLGVLGAQTVWSIDMVFAPPYLLDLGLSKSAMATVFLAGPLSGLIVQPLIGTLADNSTSRFGRRRPYLALAVTISAIGILMLGFAREIAAWATNPGSTSHESFAILIGILAVFLVDFSVNAVTALDRALMVDVATVEEQAQAMAWAARLCGLGAVLSFLIGNLDLPSMTPSMFGTTQMQIVSVFVTFILLGTHATVIWSVQEEVLLPHSDLSGPKTGITSVVRDLVQQAKQLPQPILEIFKIQFFAQIGWFPVLFYGTVWVGEIYKADLRANGGKQSDHDLFEQATRVGSRAFLGYAILSLLTSIILPMVVPNSMHAASKTVSRFSVLRRLELSRMNWPELPFWWVFAQFVFFTSMMGTWLAGLTQSVFLATLVIASVGFCFAVQNWVPFSILGILIQTQTQTRSTPTRRRAASDDVTMSLLSADQNNHVRDSGSFSPAKLSRTGSAIGLGDEDEEERSDRMFAFANRMGIERDPEIDSGTQSPEAETLGHAGTILGLHNVSIVIPQFLVTGISSLIFLLTEPSADPSGGASADDKAKNSDALGIIFRIGGCSAFIAGVLAVRFVRRYGDSLR